MAEDVEGRALARRRAGQPRRPSTRATGTTSGAMVVDELAAGPRGEALARTGRRAQVAEARLAPSGGRPGERVVLAVPTSYMNESGGQVTSAVRFFKVAAGAAARRPRRARPPVRRPHAQARRRRGRPQRAAVGQPVAGDARLQPAAGRDRATARAAWTPADFVLRDFSATERKELPFLVGDAVDAVTDVVREGWLKAQEKVNGSRRSRTV